MDTQTAEIRRRVIRGVNDVSATLRKPVALNDMFMAPVASSPHEGPLDASRLELIFGRPAPRPVLDELFEREQISHTTVEPRYIDGFNGLDLGRAFIPVRGSGGQVVGYLWVIDPERSWSATRLKELSHDVSAFFGSDLENLAPTKVIRDGSQLGRLAADAEAYRTAIIEISYPNGFDPTGHSFQRALETLESIESAEVANRFELDIAVVSQVRHGTHQTELVLAGSATALDRRRTGRVLDYLIHRFCGPNPVNTSTGRAMVSQIRGAGECVEPMLNTLRDVLALKPGPNPGSAVAFVEDSDVLMLLAELREALSGGGYQTPNSVAPLLADARTRTIAKTAKALLDSGANAQETADSLFIHRGTLYYRINQAQALTGLALTGIDRVRMHLGLIIAELTGAI